MKEKYYIYNIDNPPIKLPLYPSKEGAEIALKNMLALGLKDRYEILKVVGVGKNVPEILSEDGFEIFENPSLPQMR